MLKGGKMSEETKAKIRAAKMGANNPFFGKKLSDEHKRKISEGGKGRVQSEETRKKISDTQKGRVFTEEHRRKISDSSKGKKMSVETRKKMSGSRKGKKRKPFSEETRKKMSNAGKGREFSEEHCKRISESKKGTIPSEETRKKLSIVGKGRKRKPFSEEHRKNIGLASKGRITSEETRKKLSGENSSAWKGGISFGIYCMRFNARRKKAVRDFFNNLCICTGEPSYTRALNVHHVDHDKEQGCNGKPFNLVPLNAEHHAKEVWHQEDYKAYINKTLREGFKWGIWNEQDYIEQVMY